MPGNQNSWSEPVDYDVIVVGVGAAGAAALRRLSLGARRVLALEACDAPGGRVRSVRDQAGVIELGAEWIHGTVNSPVYKEAQSQNIDLKMQDLTFHTYRSSGSNSAIYTKVTNEVLGYCLGMEPEEEGPQGDYIKKQVNKYIKTKYPEIAADVDFMTELLEFLNLLACNYDASNDWNDVTTASNYEKLEGYQHYSWHKHGYSTIIDMLLNTHNGGPGLPNVSLRTSSPVDNISLPVDSRGAVTVRTRAGRTYTAKYVLVTVSLGVLKDCHATLFTPRLPPRKSGALSRVAMGVMDKLVLVFPDKWWPQDRDFYAFIWHGKDKKAVPPEDHWTTRIFGASQPMGCDRALTLWTSGQVAKHVETLPDDLLMTKCVELLRKFMGHIASIPDASKIYKSTWATDPNFLGSYSYDNVDSVNYPDDRLILAEPILDSAQRPRIFFAGEATHESHYSTVHGAIETGEREADRILDLCECKPLDKDDVPLQVKSKL